MLLCAYVDLLAQIPPSSPIYASMPKLGAIFLVFVVWAYFAQWTDKDTIAVNTYREIWNLIVITTGIAALLLALLIPYFLIGFPCMAVINLAVMAAYVVHRNGLVPPEDTVCTAAHFRRMQEQGFFGKKKQAKEVRERVRLTGANRELVAIPEEEEERERYRLAQDLLFDTFWRRAATVDITPAGQACKIMYQIDGIPTEREGLVRAEGDAAVQFLKQIAGLNLEERRKPQRGKVMAVIGDNQYQVLIETAGSTAGERLRIRVVGAEGQAKVSDLGFNPKQLEVVRSVMEQPRGVSLLTGPPASGVTTTVYSFTRSHDAFLQNIQMLEYDCEVAVDNVTQRQFIPTDDKTFAADLEKMARSDPDILVFPEVREPGAAALICRGGAGKIKMYVGMTAEDVFDAIRKWTALVRDKGLVAKSLSMVTNQRLVRRLCSECKQAYKPEPAMLRKLNMPADAVLNRQPEPQYDKHGNPIVCQACQGTGFVGRTAVFDTLIVDDELRTLLHSASSVSEIKNYALKKGRQGLQAQALQKVLDGITSIQEVVRVMRGQPVRPTGKGPGGAAARPKPRPKAPAGKPRS